MHNLNLFPKAQSLNELDLPDSGSGKKAQRRVQTFLLAAFAVLAMLVTDVAAYNNSNNANRRFYISGTSPSEGDSTTATITIHDKSNLSYPLNVYVWTANGTFDGYDEASSSDYTSLATTTRTFSSEGSSVTVTINTTEDDKVEGDERFLLNVRMVGAPANTTDSVHIRIVNDDYAVVSLSAQSAEEGNSMTFTAKHTGKEVDFDYTVTPSYTNGTASSTDYSGSTTALSFTGTKGESKTFTVSTTEDVVVEDNETFTANLTLGGTWPKTKGSALITATGATGTINNDDNGKVVINDASGTENGSMTFTVEVQAEAVQGGLTVTPTYTNVSASDSDYTKNTTALSFSGTYYESKTFTVSIPDDDLIEGDETFTVGLSVSKAPSAITSTDTGTGKILSDDIAYVTVNDASASEGDSMTFTVTLDEAVSGGLTVTPGFNDITTGSADYTKNTAALSFSGTKGETKTFTVSTTEDTVLEDNETFDVTLSVSNAPANGIVHNDKGRGTINNDDSAAVTINDASASEGDSMTFTVTLDEAVEIIKNDSLTVTPGYTNGTAASTDYTENTTALTFNGTKGETKTFTVSTTEDTVSEADETFTVSLSVLGGPGSVTSTDTGTGTINDDDRAKVTINNASASEGDSMTFTVTLDKAVSGGLTVTPSYTNGTAASTDYTKNTTALSFSGTAGETETFTVSTTEDAVLEGNETFTVGLTVSGTTQPVTSTDTGTGTINNDDSAAVTVNNASASEGNDMTFTVTLDTAVQGGLTVTPSFTDGTAVEGTDYDENTTALSFTGTAGETETFTVSTTEDAVLEGNETFTVGLSVSKAPSGVTSSDTGTGTVNNDDSAAVTVNNASASEGDDMTFTVTLDTAVQGGLTVTPSFTDGTAVEGTDYDENTTALSFTGTAGETETFTVSTTEDTVLEANETFTVALSVSKAPSGVTSSDTGTGTINNDDNATVTINDASASEGDDMTFTVTLDTAVQGGLKVTPSFTDGTAVEGTDYDENTTALSFTGTAGETETFTVSTTEDAVLEGNETFTVGLTVSGTTQSVTATDTGTGTINNDDSAAVNINNASASEGDDMTFTVTLDKAVQGGLTVTPSFTDGTAVEGTDYEENTTALSFTGTAGETETFTVSTNEDTVLEGNETFTVALSVSGTTHSVTSTDTGTGTVNNDDSAAVTVNNASAPEGDDMTFTVTLDKAVQGGLTVTPSFTDGTAVEGTDYEENTTALSFTGTAGETETFTVSTIDDEVLEYSETFTVGLSVSKAPSGVTSTDTGTGTILNTGKNADDATVTINDASASEGNGISFTVTLDNAVQGGVTVTPSYTNGTAAGTDYTANTTALTFTGTANETQTLTVSTTEDAVLEGNETFTVGLSVSNAPSGITATDTGTGTINNDDSAAVTIADANADEGNSMTFTVTLDKAVQGGLKVTPGYTDGTAVEGTDYDENTTALTFTGAKGETKTFTVSTTEDAVFEANETFTVDLTVSGTSLSITATDTATGTINNDDGATVTVNNASASEGDDITFTVTLGEAVQGGLTVTPGFTDGTAVEGTDYDENTTALTFTGTKGETKTFTVSTTEDAVLEGNETFTVDLTVSGTSLSITATDTGTGTVNNDDSAAVTVNDANADEGEGLTFTVTLDTAVQGGLTVTPGFTDGTAVEGTDYDENTTALNFSGTKGETREFTVSSTEDAVLEGNETFTVTLAVSNAPSGITATDTGAGAINNDDSATVTIADASADEGNGVTFTVTLDTAVQGGLTVTPGFTDGTAVEGTDYDENTTALNFSGAKGETETFTVSTREDAVLEADETFTVGLSVSKAPSGVTSTDTATGTINNDDGAVVTIADADADEGQSMTFTVTLGEAVQGGLTVTPGFTNGTASSTDYTENTTPLKFTGKDDETRTFTVSTTADAMLEADETFTVGLTVSGTSLNITATDTGTGTINDNDSATLTIDDASADEGDDLTFRVTLNQEVQGSVTVTPSYTHGTTDGEDFTANTAPLTFSGPVQARTFTVSTVQDESVEEDETFTVGLTVSGTSLGIIATDTATGTINNDDFSTSQSNQLEVKLSVSPSSVSEGAGTTTVTVTATLPEGVTLPDATGVTIQVTGGTATAGDDFRAVDDFQVTIPADAQSGTGTFTLTLIDDTEEESDETVLIQGSSESLTVGSTQLLIRDEVHEVDLSVSPSSVSEDVGATTVTVTATLPEGVTLPDDTGIAIQVTGGTATAGEDFEAVDDFQVTIPAGDQAGTGTFTLTPISDTSEEPDETVLIDGSAGGITVVQAQILITDPEDEDPASSGSRVREVPENTPSGEPIGAPVWPRDPDRDNLVYSLSGTDAESFTIDEGTGQLRTLAALDYEAVSAYEVTVEVTDGKDAEADDTVDVTINVIDVDEAPDAPDAPAVQRADTSVLGVTWTAPENGGRPAITDYDLEYRAADSDDPYQDAGYDGTATSAQISGVKAKVTYEVRVRASNDEGTSPWSAPGRETEIQNQAPVAEDDLVHVNRGEETRSLVGRETGGVSANQESRLTAPDRTNNVLANDSDAEDDVSQLTAELVTAPTNGELRLNRNGTFSYRHDGSRSTEDLFTYRAQDSDGAYSNEATVRIVVFSTNSGPVAVGTIPDQRLKMGQEGAVEVDGYFEDPDGDPLSYAVRSWDVETVTVALTGSRVGLNPVRVAATRVTVTASDPEGLSAEQTFQVEVEMLADPEQVLELSLAALGRTVASQAVDTISERFKNRTRGMQATISGQQLGVGTGSDPNQSAAAGLAGAAGLMGPGGQNPVMDLLRNPAGGPGRPVMEPISLPTAGSGITSGMAGLGGAEVFSRSDGDRMQGSSFDLTLDSDGDDDKDRGWALWGRGVGSFFSGLTLGDSSLDGQVGAVYVGADHHWGSKVVLGAAVSHSRGTLDYEDIGGVAARLGANLTAVHPYVHWSPREGLGLWGMMGLGRGTADLDLGADRKEMGIDLRMAAFGGRNELAQVGSVDLALKGDAFVASIGSEAVSGLRSVRGDTRRTRLMLEGSRTLQVSPESRLTPSVEVGVRLDGGDAETGAGMEMAGSLSYLHQPTGLSVEARGHWLAAHQAQDFRERGFGVTVRLDPGADGTGLSLQVSPAWGAQSSGAGTMWNNQGMMGAGSAAGRGEELGWLPGWTQGEVGYGMTTWGGRGLLTPFGRLDSQGPGSLRMGGGLRLALPTFLGGGGQSLIGSMAKGLSLEFIGLYEPSGSPANAGLTPDAGATGPFGAAAALFLNF